jgi:mannosyl-oligosaccharide alpha-1,2-mannosidase
MILFRRRMLSLTALTLILLLIYLYSRPNPPTPHNVSGVRPVKPSGPIDWSKVKARYPVKDMIPLPRRPNIGDRNIPKLQATFPKESPEARKERLARLEAVKSNFTHAWTGYRMYAWLADEVLPVSGGKVNPFGGWGATLVDALGKSAV